MTYVEQRFIVLPNTAGKKELYGSNQLVVFMLRWPTFFTASLVIFFSDFSCDIHNLKSSCMHEEVTISREICYTLYRV